MSAPSPLFPQTSAFHWLNPEELTSPLLQAAVSYWRKLRGDRPFPSREELKPRDMQTFLSRISLVKVIDGGADFEHRIVGDAMVQAFNVPLQNRRFTDIAKDAPEWIEHCLPLFRKVVDTGKPVAWYVRRGSEADFAVFSEAETILLPLGRTPPVVDHIVAFGVHAAKMMR